ncbi:TetR/AcrR family transcriptional regulator [Brachybacterium sp. FME24]|uniref:TetR/AcrR family transcriptional regulator n=1 Tax=Brachybacterium sp. FME24 TaxID=2742605 RepID=UPI00186854AC|nr:TetR/AcrR family transcriptional regulator [Brachybacterium sp. FME24]
MSREELRRATQSRVLAAADRLFTEQGFAVTTIRDIATEGGVSVGTVIAVGDKDALLVRVFDGLIAAHQHQGSSAPAAPTPSETAADHAQQILALVDPFIQLFTERAELARAYAAILVRARHSSTLFTQLAGELIDEIEQVLLRSGVRSADDAAPAARSIYFAYVGVLFSWAARADAEPHELPETLLPVFAAFFHTPEPSC